MNGIAKFNPLALDSNVFIYYFEANPEFIQKVRVIFEKLNQDELQAITSAISVIEVLSYPLPAKVLKEIKEGFKTMPNLTIVDIKEDIALEAAKIRRNYGFRLPDAIQLATAKLNRAKAFVTNDERLKNFKGLKIILLKEIK